MTTTDRPIDEMQTRSRARVVFYLTALSPTLPVAAAADSLLTFFSPWQNHVLISQSVSQSRTHNSGQSVSYHEDGGALTRPTKERTDRYNLSEYAT